MASVNGSSVGRGSCERESLRYRRLTLAPSSGYRADGRRGVARPRRPQEEHEAHVHAESVAAATFRRARREARACRARDDRPFPRLGLHGSGDPRDAAGRAHRRTRGHRASAGRGRHDHRLRARPASSRRRAGRRSLRRYAACRVRRRRRLRGEDREGRRRDHRRRRRRHRRDPPVRRSGLVPRPVRDHDQAHRPRRLVLRAGVLRRRCGSPRRRDHRRRMRRRRARPRRCRSGRRSRDRDAGRRSQDARAAGCRREAAGHLRARRRCSRRRWRSSAS